ncbi:hypothetical protein [Cytobacillus kochii]|uniref:hypothetical protein n=1 Tax=Cytobacillus kochii TaxID=859143 RepID=UPI00203CA4B1|nr:hypothetical protein [Cytobacillus kochii]MCM3324556.1 hypothetical protein [Cytobacillus kochii]MCM3346949.1 hypothetical protein [Cytobacillus kochii]
MARRIVETNAVSLDREKPIYEEGISKQQIRNENPYSKRHGLFSPVPGLMR